MNTKEKILFTALRLFNEQGIDVITIRHIAKEMEISHSNIQYYFRNADEIIAALYTQHIDELNALPPLDNAGIVSLQASIAGILQHIYHYRFVYIHFVVIARRIPVVKKVYSQRFIARRAQLLQVFEHFRQQGLMRDDIPAGVWESLVRNIYIIGDFWISANELTTGLKGKKAVGHYAEMIGDVVYPYLTEKGRGE
jgi:AcrR family transcriptional regulator